MRKILLLGLFLLSGFCFGQTKYSIQNFLAFSIVSSSDFDKYMTKDNFEMVDSEKKETSYKLIYQSRIKDMKNLGTITTSRDFYSDSLLTYSFYNEEEDNRLIKNLHDLNYKLSYSENKDGVLVKYYVKEDTSVFVYKIYDKEKNFYMYMYSFSIKRDK